MEKKIKIYRRYVVGVVRTAGKINAEISCRGFNLKNKKATKGTAYHMVGAYFREKY